RQPEDLRLARDRALRLDRAAPPRLERPAEERLDHRRRAGAEERRERRAGTRVAAERAAALAVGLHDAEPDVEHEDAERQRLQHDLDEALLGVELPRPLRDHALERRIETRVLERD